MATLAENAAAVKAAQVAIDAAIVAKGGTTAGGLTNAAAGIATIPSGGGCDEWTPPDDWRDASGNKIDLREIVEMAKTDEYMAEHGIDKSRVDGVCAVLLSPNAAGYKLISYSYYGLVLDDGTSPDSGNWAPSFGYHWIVIYKYKDSRDLIFEFQYMESNWWSNGRPLLWICGDGEVVADVGYQAGFDYAYLLQRIERLRLKVPCDISSGQVGYTAFNAYVRSIACDKVTFYSNGGTVSANGFTNCRMLPRIPPCDLSGQILSDNLFLNNESLLELPWICPNTSAPVALTYNFSSSHQISPQSIIDIADDIANGVLRAGLSMDATGAANPLTITISARVKRSISDAEWTRIVGIFSDHGWTISAA